MSELKCPICGQELKHEKITGIYCCPTNFIDCQLGLGAGAFGTKELWQALICTRKALDIAIQYIKHTQRVEPFWFNRLANKTLDEIETALEQKDNK